MFNRLPNGVKNIFILTCLVGLAQIGLPRLGIDVTEMLALYYPDSNFFRPWQVFTHIFCHGSIAHFVFNMVFGLLMFGSAIEVKLGTRRFIYLYFISGLGAVLLHFLVTALRLYVNVHDILPVLHGIIPNPDHMPVTGIHLSNGNFIHYGPMVGASGALYGVLIAFAYYFPNEEMIFLIIPYPIKAKYLVPIIVAIDLIFGVLDYSADPIAHFAHLGGAITGFIIVRFWFSKWVGSNR